MSGLTADRLYGTDPLAQQPTPTAAPLHAVTGSPEPTMQTHPLPTTQKPLLALVGLLAVAVLLTQVSFRGTISVRG